MYIIFSEKSEDFPDPACGFLRALYFHTYTVTSACTIIIAGTPNRNNGFKVL